MVFILICPANREAKRGSPILNDSSLASETLGAKIRRLRSEIGIGQERLAIESHVDQSGLSKFERGKDNRALSEAALRRIAITLGTSFENLVDGTGYPLRQS
jgi:transcriptional regulator with XRE-family HTH domain